MGTTLSERKSTFFERRWFHHHGDAKRMPALLRGALRKAHTRCCDRYLFGRRRNRAGQETATSLWWNGCKPDGLRCCGA